MCCSRYDRLAINQVVYSELSAGFTAIEQVEEVLGLVGITIVQMSRPALFMAAPATCMPVP